MAKANRVLRSADGRRDCRVGRSALLSRSAILLLSLAMGSAGCGQNDTLTAPPPWSDAWVRTSGPGGGTVRALAVSGTSIFAGTDISGLYRSTNNGASWTAVNNGMNPPGSLRYVSAVAVSGTTVYAGIVNEGMYRSTNNGASWTAINNGLTGATVLALAVSGSSCMRGPLVAGWSLAEQRGSWTALALGGSTVYALAVNGNSMFAGSASGEAVRSTDEWATWTAVSIGVTNTPIVSLAVSGTNLFAGTEGGGVYRSTDDGASWTAVNNGLTGTAVRSLLVAGNNVFAGSHGGGVFNSTDNVAS